MAADAIASKPATANGKATELNGAHALPGPQQTSGQATAFPLVAWLQTIGISIGLFVGAFVICAGICLLFNYSYRSTAAMSAVLAGVIVTILRVVLPNPMAKTKTQPAPQPAPTDSVREVIETVVFVVVLVLLLKSFVAEAFVIPTGSMAETLFGYQKIVTCPKCHYVFPVNVSQEVDPSDGPSMPIVGCSCPNCRYLIDLDNTNTTWSSGDRVLVGKYFYELVDQPERLEVVVFKYPGDDYWPSSGPFKNHIPLNYIKRLIGKPGETIAIFQGKLYVLSPELSPHYDDWKNAQSDPELMARLWQRTFQHVNDARELLFTDGKFSMIRKPPDTMLAMARIVYDNDHPASDRLSTPRWQGDGWTSDGANGFTSNDIGGMNWLRYHHLLRGQDRKTLITDFTGYNTFVTKDRDGRFVHGPPAENWVGDLLLETELTIDKADGEFVMELSKSHSRYQARWNLATGDCNLFVLRDGKEERIGTAKTPVSVKGHTYRLRFADVDGKLTVWVDGLLPFGEDGVLYPQDFENIGPTAANDLEPASIGVQGGTAHVRKIRLLRDTYYTNDPSRADYSNVDFGDPTSWSAMSRKDVDKVKTIYVQPGHYLCLGDNSPESSDGRSWGCVPERLLLGRAMMVYYPFWPFGANRAGKIR
jgi:signal peptidase I